MNESKFWGPHPLENVYAIEWVKVNFLDDTLNNITLTLTGPKKKENVAEIRAAAFLLHKLALWFKDVYDLKPLIDLAVEKLSQYSENEEVLKKYEFSIALKDQIKSLKEIKKELL